MSGPHRHAYSVYGLRLEAERALRLLEEEPRPLAGHGCAVDVRFADQAVPADVVWVQERLAHGEPWLGIGRTSNGFVLRFHDEADFFVRSDGRVVVCATEDAEADSVEQLLVDQVLPHVLHLLGRLVFHGSAVADAEGRVVGFLGDSGAGKSTLAAALAQRGWRLVTDDCLAPAITPAGIVVHPGYPFTRLLPDAATALYGELGGAQLAPVAPRSSKVRSPHGAAPAALDLRALLVLGFGDEASIVWFPPVRGIAALVEQLHRLDDRARSLLELEFEALGALVSRVDVGQLRRPRRFDAVDDVDATLRAYLEAPRGR